MSNPPVKGLYGKCRATSCPSKNFRALILLILMYGTLAAVTLLTKPAHAQTRESNLTSEMVLSLYKSGILELQKSPSRISVGNPGIADILILRSNQVHVLGKALGSTNVVFWDTDDRIFATVNIEVTHDLTSLKQKLHQMMPMEDIRVYSAQENLILDGKVSSASNLNAAFKVAEGYLPECISSESASGIQGQEAESNADACENAEVVNLMSVVGSQQIMLEVKVAEMARTFRRSMDTDLSFIDFGNPTRGGVVNGGATFPDALNADGLRVPYIPAGIPNGQAPILGPVMDEFAPNMPSISDKGLFFSDLSGGNFFSAALELSRSKGLAKVLAEPNLTTLTGRPAEFISGGEFPVPVPDDGKTTIIFKEYGVSVKFIPTILDSNAISLDLDILVSELAEGSSIDLGLIGTQSVFSIPSLTKRGVSSTVELSDGQTLGIAGLIQDNVTEVLTKLPGLGDIPILGNLFRSQQFVSGQTELVIFVTPHLAKPIAPEKVRLPTDSFVPPNDLEFYLLGRMTSLKKAKPINRQRGVDGGFDGLTFGHDL